MNLTSATVIQGGTGNARGTDDQGPVVKVNPVARRTLSVFDDSMRYAAYQCAGIRRLPWNGYDTPTSKASVQDAHKMFLPHILLPSLTCVMSLLARTLRIGETQSKALGGRADPEKANRFSMSIIQDDRYIHAQLARFHYGMKMLRRLQSSSDIKAADLDQKQLSLLLSAEVVLMQYAQGNPSLQENLDTWFTTLDYQNWHAANRVVHPHRPRAAKQRGTRNQPTFPIYDLPSVIISKVLVDLSLELERPHQLRCLSSLSRVNQRCNAVFSPLLWQSINHRDCRFHASDGHLLSIAFHLSVAPFLRAQVRHVSIVLDVHSATLHEFIRVVGPGITSLRLWFQFPGKGKPVEVARELLQWLADHSSYLSKLESLVLTAVRPWLDYRHPPPEQPAAPLEDATGGDWELVRKPAESDSADALSDQDVEIEEIENTSADEEDRVPPPPAAFSQLETPRPLRELASRLTHFRSTGCWQVAQHIVAHLDCSRIVHLTPGYSCYDLDSRDALLDWLRSNTFPRLREWADLSNSCSRCQRKGAMLSALEKCRLERLRVEGRELNEETTAFTLSELSLQDATCPLIKMIVPSSFQLRSVRIVSETVTPFDLRALASLTSVLEDVDLVSTSMRRASRVLRVDTKASSTFHRYYHLGTVRALAEATASVPSSEELQDMEEELKEWSGAISAFVTAHARSIKTFTVLDAVLLPESLQLFHPCHGLTRLDCHIADRSLWSDPETWVKQREAWEQRTEPRDLSEAQLPFDRLYLALPKLFPQEGSRCSHYLWPELKLREAARQAADHLVRTSHDRRASEWSQM